MKLKFGAQCPMCQQVYEIEVDTDKKADGGATMISCIRCKAHPVLNWITTYAISEMKGVKVYPPKPKLEMIKLEAK